MQDAQLQSQLKVSVGFKNQLSWNLCFSSAAIAPNCQVSLLTILLRY